MIEVFEALLLAGMALVLLALAGLLGKGSRALAPGVRGEIDANPARWPRLALIVPVAGAPPALGECLRSLLYQDYPDYQVIFATRDREDPATSVIASLIWDRSRGRLVLSGPARTSGQKNHNLLAGVRLAGEDPEVLAFCDSNQVAPPDFLRRLVAPLARGEGEVASGYHHIIPGDQRLPTWGRAVAVLTLYLTKAVPWLNQPWGGATAIRRDLFARLGVERLWAETVVDDVSLAARLIQARVPVRLAAGADLATPLAGETLADWESWLFRQCIYLKYYLPGSWLAAGAFLHLLTCLTLLSVVWLFLAPLDVVTPWRGFTALVFLATLSVLALVMRSLHPRPGSWPRWLAACLAALCLVSWVHVRTCLTQKISWRGTAYGVDWRGRVVSILEEKR